MHKACYRFQISHPDVTLLHEIYNFHECREKLLCRELDAVFTLSFEVSDEVELCSAQLGEVRQYFLIPRSWHFSNKQILDYSALSGRNLLLEPNEGSKIYGSICSLYKINPTMKYVDTTLLLLHEVTEGKGFTITNRNVPLSRRALVDFIPVMELTSNLRIDCVIAWRNNDKSRLLRDFVHICKDIREEENAFQE
jgi:DNA-binding transcriptional LysR family regulator